MWLTIVLIPVGYILGMFPSAVLVAKARGIDITQAGSGNPGASNVMRVLGWRVGALVMLADFGKGALAAGLGLWVGGRPGAYVLGVCAVLGHTFPLLRKGGKGVAAAGGMLMVLYPLVVLALIITWVVVSKLSHKASIASLVIICAFPISVGIIGYAGWEVGMITAIALLLLVRHASNIRRLVRREENELVPRASVPR
jgi:acyl phosphate:glycerol-3-phosphate acyltransferase